MSSKTTRNFKSFGEALSWAIANRQLEQKEFAEEMAIKESTISKYVNDALNPPREKRLVRFGRFLGVEFNQRPDGSWDVDADNAVSAAADAVRVAEEQAASYNKDEPGEDEILQSLERAEKLIRRSLEQLKRLHNIES